MKKTRTIDGTYCTAPVGVCRYEGHPGALSKEQVKKHHCIGRKCKHFEQLRDFEKKKTKRRKKWHAQGKHN